MKQQTTSLRFNPWNGQPFEDDGAMRTAEGYRKAFPDREWFYNPWAGNIRHRLDWETDPAGILILPPFENLLSFTPSKES